MRHALADPNAARVRLQIHARKVTRIRECAEIREALRAAMRPGNFLLLLRIAELGRIAWRDGREEARLIESRCVRVLDAVGRRILRAGDLIAHDAGTGDICIFLRARRETARTPVPADARTVVQRLVTALRREMPLEIEHGWIDVHAAGMTELEPLCEAALQRGKIETERFAFFSAVGHELRTPLAAIRGSLEIVCDSSSDAAVKTRFADIAHRETERLTRLVDALFTLSLDEEIPHATCASAVAPAVATALGAQSFAATGAGILTEVVIPTDLPKVAIPEDRLVQILVILLDNAVKHGRVARIRISAACAGSAYVTLLIEDDGVGVAEADRERIFFFGERGSSNSAGTGIGLALVRRFIERFDGSATCTTSGLSGAAFALRLRTA